MQKPTAYILGAGITGLSAGSRLSENNYRVVVLEKNGYIGGLATTFQRNGYHLDLGPHKIFSLMEDILNKVKNLIGDELLTIQKKSKIRLKDKYLNYPVKILDILFGLNPTFAMSCFFSYFSAFIRKMRKYLPEDSYRDWLVNRFGKVIYKNIFEPYALKIWGEPSGLSRELAETRVAVPNLFEMIRQMILGIRKSDIVTSASEFYYAKYGILTLSKRFEEIITKRSGEIRLNSGLKKMEVSKGKIDFFILDSGEKIEVEPNDVIISTIGLKTLKETLSSIPRNVSSSIDLLKTRNLILEYLVINRPDVLKDNWIFFPGEKYIFNRIFEQKRFSSFMVPKDRTVLCLEVTCDPESLLWKMSDMDIYGKTVLQLEECGIVKREEIIEHFDKRIEDVYQIYNIDYRINKKVVFDFFDSIRNFFSVGRHGDFNYVGMLDCIDMGFRTADYIIHKKDGYAGKLRASFQSYKVID